MKMWVQNDDGTAQIQRGLLAVTNFQRYFDSGHYRVVQVVDLDDLSKIVGWAPEASAQSHF